MFKEICQNLFTITFATEADKSNILDRRPWLFDTYLFTLRDLDSKHQPKLVVFDSETFWVQFHNLLVKCMDRYYGSLIGEAIVKMVDVNVEVDEKRLRTFLREQIQLPLDKKLARCCLLTVKGESIWISFIYEKLPQICFYCGKIFHEIDCTLVDRRDSLSQYDSWLRVETRKKMETPYGGD